MGEILTGAGYRPIGKARYATLVGVWLVLAVSDFFIMPLVDPYARHGSGYEHHDPARYRGDPECGAMRGYRRVIFTFRHFPDWWLAWPSHAGVSPVKLLVSDGNSMVTNLFGHLGVSLILSLIAMFLVPMPLFVGALGTGMNVFHEYVAEGQYCDPSFIDLWLGQVGLLAGIALFIYLQRGSRFRA